MHNMFSLEILNLHINTNYYIKFNCHQSTASLTETKAGNEASYKEDKNKNFTQQHKE